MVKYSRLSYSIYMFLDLHLCSTTKLGPIRTMGIFVRFFGLNLYLCFSKEVSGRRWWLIRTIEYFV